MITNLNKNPAQETYHVGCYRCNRLGHWRSPNCGRSIRGPSGRRAGPDPGGRGPGHPELRGCHQVRPSQPFGTFTRPRNLVAGPFVWATPTVRYPPGAREQRRTWVSSSQQNHPGAGHDPHTGQVRTPTPQQAEPEQPRHQSSLGQGQHLGPMLTGDAVRQQTGLAVGRTCAAAACEDLPQGRAKTGSDRLAQHERERILELAPNHLSLQSRRDCRTDAS